MNVEQAICNALVTAIQLQLPNLQVEGNWLIDDTDIKGVESTVGPKISVKVDARKYGGYSSPIAEFGAIVSCDYPMADDTSLVETIAAYDALVALLETWHHDISAVKRDLTCEHFTPFGFKLDGGPFDIDRETKERSFTQQFTIKGRIS